MTAYEMRISDWSSDVCASDLDRGERRSDPVAGLADAGAGPEGLRGAGMTVWAALVGQRPVITALSDAASGRGMSQAFLFTGPPGSGRSNAAVAFAGALPSEQAGCGPCQSCRTVLAGSPADVHLIRTQKPSNGRDQVSER